MDEPRTRDQRRQDTIRRLEQDVDVWVATADGNIRLTLGETRDVVVIEGAATQVTPSDEVADAFARRAGFDPRTLKQRYPYFRVTSRLVQAWREVNEITERDLMRDGEWI
jgi:hypothetical protein